MAGGFSVSSVSAWCLLLSGVACVGGSVVRESGISFSVSVSVSMSVVSSGLVSALARMANQALGSRSPSSLNSSIHGAVLTR